MHLKVENLASLNLQCLRNNQNFVKIHSLLQYGAGLSEILFLRRSKGDTVNVYPRITSEILFREIIDHTFFSIIWHRYRKKAVIQGSEGILCTLGKKKIREFVSSPQSRVLRKPEYSLG